MMFQTNPFAKRLIRDEREDVFHTSTYAKAQSGEVMGAASTETFAERQKIDQNRQMIRGYNDSRVAAQRFNGGHAKQYTPPEPTLETNTAMTKAEERAKAAAQSVKKPIVMPTNAPKPAAAQFRPNFRPPMGGTGH